MPVELVVHVGERTRRHTLEHGEVLIGSSSGSAVRILHPTVSRRHAKITVAATWVSVEDLGSRNGTRVGGKAVDGATTIEPGTVLSFGGVSALLERVDEDDLEPALLLNAGDGPASSTDVFDLADVVTASVEPFDHFMRERLPELLDTLRAGGTESQIVASVGQAVASSLPCLGLLMRARGQEVWRLASGGDLVPDDDGLLVTRRDDLELYCQLPTARLVDLFRPLTELALGLVALARRRSEPLTRPTAPPEQVPPPLPAPASVEARVRQVYAEAARIARGNVSVLIRGESGTGKEVLAQWIHAASARAGGSFLALNCAALPKDLLEAELFGIERGVATGVEARPGMFERATGGTLLLDEVGDMALETQVKLLRALEVGELYRVGGRQPYPVDVRIVAATNRDLEGMMDGEDFRSDLYFRIADWEVELPPLRERPGDIPQLAGHFLSEESRRHGRRIRGISRAAMAALSRFDWPGNIRQLRKEMARVALLVGPGELLDSTRLDPVIAAAGRARTLKETLQSAERQVLERVLDECGGDRQEAARRLEMSDITLYRRIKLYEL